MSPHINRNKYAYEERLEKKNGEIVLWEMGIFFYLAKAFYDVILLVPQKIIVPINHVDL